MKVTVIQTNPVFRIELTPDEAWSLKVLFGSLSDSQITSLLGSSKYYTEIEKVIKITDDLYESLPSDKGDDL